MLELKTRFESIFDFSDPLPNSVFFKDDQSKVLKRVSAKDFTQFLRHMPTYGKVLHLGGAAYDCFANDMHEKSLDFLNILKKIDNTLPEIAITYASGFMMKTDKIAYKTIMPFLNFSLHHGFIKEASIKKSTIQKTYNEFLESNSDEMLEDLFWSKG